MDESNLNDLQLPGNQYFPSSIVLYIIYFKTGQPKP